MIPLEAWFELTESRKLLVKNLMCNLEVMFPEETTNELKQVLRLQLIMIRQCMLDEGIK